jgi:DNA mismatch repair protein MutH
MHRLALGLCVAEGELVEEVHESVDGWVGLLLDRFLVDDLGGKNMDGGVVVGLEWKKFPKTR